MNTQEKIVGINPHTASKTSHRRRRIGMRKRTAISVFAVLSIALALTVGAALLTHYGTIKTTATVEQSVVISDGTGWANFDTPLLRPLGEVVSCNDYTYKAWIWNRACSEAPVEIIDVCTEAPNNDPTGFDITHFIIGGEQTINFYYKNPVTWAKLGESIATLTFDTCNPQFVYTLDVTGATANTDYSLIYYADQQNRFTNWGGDPLKLINAFTTDASGNYHMHVTHYGMQTLPYADDWNAGLDADYTQSPDSYAHAKGAKFWVVPTVDIPGIVDNTVWNPTTYLFEDDLALYIDCDDITPVWLPHVYPLFSTTTLQPESEYCWITFYHTALNIWPGNYAFTTWLNPN